MTFSLVGKTTTGAEAALSPRIAWRGAGSAALPRWFREHGETICISYRVDCGTLAFTLVRVARRTRRLRPGRVACAPTWTYFVWNIPLDNRCQYRRVLQRVLPLRFRMTRCLERCNH